MSPHIHGGAIGGAQNINVNTDSAWSGLRVSGPSDYELIENYYVLGRETGHDAVPWLVARKAIDDFR